MSADVALLADILAQPEDDGLRLVYADWLEDRGAPGDAERAELIRVQCRLAPMAQDDPHRTALARRERHLLSAHGRLWWQELPDWVEKDDPLDPLFGFRRGFVYEVGADTAALLARADELWGRFPVQSLRLRGVTGRGGALAACPHLVRLRELDVSGNGLGSAEVCALVSSPHLANLEALSLAENAVGDTGALALAEATHLTRLTFLDLRASGVGAVGARALLDAPHLGKLTFLDLSANPTIGTAVAEAVRQRFGTAALIAHPS
jgi:uncharacterized protein (TIGR02996 family)